MYGNIFLYIIIQKSYIVSNKVNTHICFDMIKQLVVLRIPFKLLALSLKILPITLLLLSLQMRRHDAIISKKETNIIILGLFHVDERIEKKKKKVHTRAHCKFNVQNFEIPKI